MECGESGVESCPRLFALHRGGGWRSYIVNFGMVALACNFVFILYKHTEVPHAFLIRPHASSHDRRAAAAWRRDD